MDEQVSIIQEQEGTITFSNEVLANIVGVAACDIPGVADMCGGFKDGIVDLLGRKNFTKGVKITVKDNCLEADLAIAVNYGVCVPEVCAKIRESVKKAIDTMTGLSVSAINVSVESLYFKSNSENED